MKTVGKPQINAAIISIVSAFYAFTFIVTSGHIEFERILNRSNTLSNGFWNAWSDFLKCGHIKYIGYTYIVLAAVIVILSLVRKRDYDEYQTGILEKGIIIMGTAMVLLFPLAFLLVLSDPSYIIETMMLLVVLHWSIVLIAVLAYSIKWCRN